MMKNLTKSMWLTLCGAAALTATIGCSQDEFENAPKAKGNVTLTAGFEGAGDTRTSIGTDDRTLYWNNGDAFELFYTPQNGSVTSATFTTNLAESSVNADFTGHITDPESVTPSYAVYPSYTGTKPTLAGSIVAVTFPATISNYTACPTPMYAKVDDINGGSNLSFKHLAGILKLSVSSTIPEEATKLVITTDKVISGEFTADLSQTDEAPVLATSAGVTSENSKVTIDLSATTSAAGGIVTFYIPLPENLYGFIKAELQDASNNALAKAKEWKNVYVLRASLMRSTFGFEVIDVTAGDTSKSAIAKVNEGLNSILPGANDAPEAPVTTTVEVSGAVDATADQAPIVIPPVKNSNVELTLQTVPTTSAESPLTIANAAEGDPEDTAPLTNVAVAIPPVTESETTAPHLVIDMPKSTVTLQATAAETGTTFEKVVATTAPHTLIVGENVTIKELTVKEGNLKLLAGAKIESLVYAGSDNVVFTILANTDQVPNPLPAGFALLTTGTGDEQEEAARMKANFALGKSYTLQANADIRGMAVTVPATTTEPLILDLNGFTIKADNNNESNLDIEHHNFILKDSKGGGKIEAMADYSTTCSYGIVAINGENAKMTMEGGTINAVRTTPANKGQFGVSVNAGGDFTMTGGKIEAGWFAIAGNGDNNTQNSEINITGGELTSAADFALYLPHSGTTIISGGTITGAAGGVGMRNGTLTIKDNAKIICTGNGDTGDWGDGTGNMGNAVINIGGGKANIYGNCVVNVEGGTLTAEGESTVFSVQPTPNSAKGTITMNVTGGNYSDPTVLDYLGANANVQITLNGNVAPTGFGYQMNAEGATATVNLNGHDIINSTEAIDGAYGCTNIFTVDNGTLNIEGDGNVKCDASATEKEDGYRMAVWARNNGVINIKGGSYYNTQKKNTQIDLIYANNNGTINISGGTFESGRYGTPDDDVNGRYWVLNIKNADKATASINVTGGTFINFNPSCPNMDDKTPYTEAGYETLRDGVAYTEAHKLADGRKEYTVQKTTE